MPINLNLFVKKLLINLEFQINIFFGVHLERVASLLNPKNPAYSLYQALVRLWVLAGDDVALNQWEQENNEKTIGPAYEAFLDQIQNANDITLQAIHASPLALIRALDDFLWLYPHRFLPASFPFNEDGADYWLVSVILASRRKARMNLQAVNRAHWFRHHAVFPTRTAHGIAVKLQSSRSALDAALNQLVHQADAKLQVWIAHFDDQADVQWDRNNPVQNWRSTGVEPHATRQASLYSALQTAQNEGAHIVVFPEFTLDLQHRERLREYLRTTPESNIQLVIAGAFHEAENSDSAMPAYNTAPVYRGDGVHLFSHRKLRPYGNSKVGAEYVDLGNELTVLATPIGCMTVLICKDFLDEHPRVDNLLAEVPVDWVWVPSFGDQRTLDRHKDRAKRLATLITGTSSAVAHTQNTAMTQQTTTLDHLPGFGHQADQPTPKDVSVTGSLVSFKLDRLSKPSTSQRPKLKRIK